MRTSGRSVFALFFHQTLVICVQFHVFEIDFSFLDVFEVMGQFSDLVSSFEEKISFWWSVSGSEGRSMVLHVYRSLLETQT